MTMSASDFISQQGHRPPPDAGSAAWLQAARFYREAHHRAGSDILDVAKREQRDLRASEDRAFCKHLGEVEEFNALIAEGEREARKADDARRPVERFVRPADYQAAYGGGDGEGLRAFIRGETRSFDMPLTGEFRALSKLSSAAGGYAVPTSFRNQLVEHMVNQARLIEAATVITTTGGENLQVPTTTAMSTATLTAEAAVIASSDPAFSQITLAAYKYAILTQVSNELLDDSAVDVEGFLGRQAGVAIGNAFGAHLMTGTGTGQPRGITLDTTAGVTGATGVAGMFTADNLIDLQYSVIPAYRGNGTWLMNDTTLAAVRKLKDTTNQYLFQPSMVAGTPDLLLGRPIITDPNVPAIGLGAKSVLFGDLSRYYVRMAGGFRLERSDDFAFSSDLVTFRAVVRVDGRLADLQGAVKHYVGGAT